MELFQHQKKFLSKKKDRDALIWGCGTGKTRTACEWTKQDKFIALVICPKALKENWKREIERAGALCHVKSKEEFKKEVLTGIIKPYYQVIVDEVHNGFLTPQFKSQMSKCLKAYIKKYNPRVLLLTATPYTSSPWNIFSIATLLGYNWNYQEFSWKYFDHIRMGLRMIPVPKKNVASDMAILVKQIADVVDIHDVMDDVPLQNHCEPEYFALTKEQIKGIKDNYDPVHIVRYTRQHEIENGVLLGDEHGLIKPQTFDCDKFERILELVQENKKAAIVCRYNMQIETIANFLKEKVKDRPIFIIQGATKNRDQITLEAEAAKEAIVLIQADCAEGYQLPSFELCVFASMSYSYAKFEQICGRFLRMDKPSRTTFLYLISGEKSVDQAVYEAIQRKEDFKVELYKK